MYVSVVVVVVVVPLFFVVNTQLHRTMLTSHMHAAEVMSIALSAMRAHCDVCMYVSVCVYE